jgi:hypothetical protein
MKWYWLHVVLPMLGFAGLVLFSLVVVIFVALASRVVVDWWRNKR